jgi:gas vesicle protein GvpL/GvpF
MTASTPVSKRTSVYVYGVTWIDGAPGRPGAGVGGADVELLEHGELAAVVSVVPEGPVRARRRDLLRHLDVLQDVFASSAVLPLPFGSTFAGGDVVVSGLLGQRYEELVDLLQRFEGLGELRVRAAYREDQVLADIVRSEPKIARLRDATRGAHAADPRLVQLGEAVARALAARREHDVGALASELRRLALDVAVEEPRADLELMRASFLVERRRIPDFDARMNALAREQRDRIGFTYTGPLPPHSFVAVSRGPG